MIKAVIGNGDMDISLKGSLEEILGDLTILAMHVFLTAHKEYDLDYKFILDNFIDCLKITTEEYKDTGKTIYQASLESRDEVISDEEDEEELGFNYVEFMEFLGAFDEEDDE